MNLETASPSAQAGGLRRVAIDPVSRVEGHGKVTILLDAQNRRVGLGYLEMTGYAGRQYTG